MSWFHKQPTKKTWLQNIACQLLKGGKIPKHIAIIMDGNRRYARKQQIKKLEGHTRGFSKLTEVMEWCSDLGIKELTVYAFSIENFKRTKEEVEGLMELAREKFKRLLEEREEIAKHDVCVRVYGDMTLLPVDLQRLMAEVMFLTRNNTSAYLNVCFSYTSRHEICHAMDCLIQGVKQEKLVESDMTEELLSRCLYSGRSLYPEPDLLIRTSGEVRLSDFQLWQSSYSVLAFVSVLWPDVTIWDFYGAILHYQINYKEVEEAKITNIARSRCRNKERLVNVSEVCNKTIEECENEQLVRQRAFLNDLEDEHWTYLEKLLPDDKLHLCRS